MTAAVVAYVPVLHEGYRRFLEEHGRGLPLYLIGPELHRDDRALAKDVRALSADDARAAIAAWGICASVSVLDEVGAHALAAESPALVLPAEDVSVRIVERYFPRCPIRYDTVFLRWDASRTVRLLRPVPHRVVTPDAAWAELAGLAEEAAATSVDWWRQVGAAMRCADGSLHVAVNEHRPHPLAAYAVGDPRASFSKGVHLELSTAEHAEAQLIAAAARAGVSTECAALYVTDFPCPPCAKLVAGAGIATLCFRTGYAVLDGQDVLERAGVEIVQVADAPPTA